MGDKTDDDAEAKGDNGDDVQNDKQEQDQKSKDLDKKDGDSDDQKGEDEKPRSKLPIFIAAIVVIILIIAGVIYWIATEGEVSTDDAYTEGRAVSIAANVSGYVTGLYVNDNTYVHAGDLMIAIDPRDNQASLAQARANLVMAQVQVQSAEVDLQETTVKAPAQLQQAEAQLTQAQAQQEQTLREYRRQHAVDQRGTTQTNVDQSTEQLRSADASVKQAQAQVASASLVGQMIASSEAEVAQRRAQVTQAEANLASAKVKLSYNEIRAPQDGWITMRNAELGGYLQSGQQIFYIVTPQIWVVANYKETQLTHMKIGQFVTMAVDAYPSLTLHGHVQSIQQGSGARFTAFPVENATGNFVKIVRRVPVKILVDSGMPPNLHSLGIGLSVEPTVHEK